MSCLTCMVPIFSLVGQASWADERSSAKVVIVNPAKPDASKVTQKSSYYSLASLNEAAESSEKKKEKEQEPPRPIGAVGAARAYYYFMKPPDRNGNILFTEGESIETLRLRGDVIMLRPGAWKEFAPAGPSTTAPAPASAAMQSQAESIPQSPATIAPTQLSAAPSAQDTSDGTQMSPAGEQVMKGNLQNEMHYRDSMSKIFESLMQNSAPTRFDAEGRALASTGQPPFAPAVKVRDGFAFGEVKQAETLGWSQTTPEWQLWYFVDMQIHSQPRLSIKAVVSNRTDFSWENAQVVLHRDGSPWQFHVEPCTIHSANVSLVNIEHVSFSEIVEGKPVRTYLPVKDIPLDTIESNLYWDLQTKRVRYAVQFQSCEKKLPFDDTARVVMTRDNEATIIFDQRHVFAGEKKLWLLDDAVEVDFKVKDGTDKIYVSSVDFDGVNTKIRKTTTYEIVAAVTNTKVMIPVYPVYRDSEELPIDLAANAATAAQLNKGYLVLDSCTKPSVLVTDRFVSGSKVNLLTDSVAGLEAKLAGVPDNTRVSSDLKEALDSRAKLDDIKKQISPLEEKIKGLLNSRYNNLTTQMTSSSARVLDLIEAQLRTASMELEIACSCKLEVEDCLRLKFLELESDWRAYVDQQKQSANAQAAQSAPLAAPQSPEAISAAPLVNSQPSPSNMQPCNEQPSSAVPSNGNSSILIPNSPTEFVPGASIPPK